MTKEEYIGLLREATRALEDAPRDGSMLMGTWEPSTRPGDKLDYWRDDCLFDDTDEGIVINGETVALVSIPPDYLVISGDSLEVALEELSYIEQRLLAEEDLEEYTLAAWSDKEREARRELKVIIQKFKQLLKDYMRVKLSTEAKTLAEFEENWGEALSQLIEMIAGGLGKVLDIALSIIPLADWSKAGDWIVVAGGRLPRAVKGLSPGLQMFIRWLMSQLRKMWGVFSKLIRNLARLLGLSGEGEEENDVKKSVEWVIKLIQTPGPFVVREVWDTDELEKDVSKWVNKAAKKVGDKDTTLSQEQGRHLSACLTEIRDTLTEIKGQTMIVGLTAQAVSILMGVPAITAAGLPVVALGLGSIIVAGIMVLVVMGADTLRDKPHPGRYKGIAPLAEKRLKNLPTS